MFEALLSGLACVFFLALSMHILFSPRRVSTQGAGLAFSIIIFCLVEAFSGLISAGYTSFEEPLLFAESLLPLTALLFGLTYGRKDPLRGAPLPMKALAALAFVFPASAVLLPYSAFFPAHAYHEILPLGSAGYPFYLGIMFYCIIALFNIEVTFKAVHDPEKWWGMKFEVIGYGAIFAVLVFYYSQGLLYHSIDMGFVPVRSGVFIISALLILYSGLFRGRGIRVTVSRYVVYRSMTALVVGGYLISLGLIGLGIKYLGLSFGKGVTAFAAFAAGIFTVILLLSSRFRREVKVFVSKHFYAHKHDYRAVWLSFTDQLAHCRTIGQVEDAILGAFIDVFGLKGAALYLYNKDRGSYVLSAESAMPLEAKEIRVSAGLVSYLLKKNRVLNPADKEYLPTMEEAAFFRAEGRCLAVPLAANGELEGIILLGGQLTHEELTYEDFDVMKSLAKQSSLSLRIFKLSEELSQAREMAAVARMSSFVMHDLKNLASSFSLLLENSRQHMADPEFQQDMILTIQNTLSKMLELIRKLKGVPEKLVLKPEPTDLQELVGEVVEEVKKANGRAAISFYGEAAVSMADKGEFKKVVINLLFNSVEATAQKGTISVETGRAGESVFLRTRDDGCGMSQDFMRNGLFKPFRTTKAKGLGIGLCQCKQIVEAHGGRIEVQSEEGKGSVFTVYLPASDGAGIDKANESS